jgi:4-amino-4-deoxy-L-arabinose transferase-like glycosyltransferase
MIPAKRGWIARLLSPVAIALAALAVRLAFTATMGNRYYFADTAEYEAAAMQILAGEGPGASTPRAPLYPAFMALGFVIGGPGNYVAVRVLQALAGSALVALTAALATRLGGRGAGVVAGVLMAFGPLYVFTSAMLYPTTLYSLLLVASVTAALALAERPRVLPAAGLGLALAAGWLTDQVMVAPMAAILAWLASQVRRHGARLAVQGLLVLAVMAAVVLPVVARQRQAYGGEAVFMQKAQYVLHWARTDSTMAHTRRVRLGPGEYRPLPARAFLAREAELVRTQPAAYAGDVAAEFVHFFRPVPDRIQTQNRYNRPHVLIVAALHFVPVMLLALLGLALGRTQAAPRVLLAAVVFATAAFYAFFFTQTRYRIPVEPFLVVLAALGFARLFPRLAALLGGEGAGAVPAASPSVSPSPRGRS